MLSRTSFVQESLATHLFFGRIMKEHSFFLQIGFTSKDSAYENVANQFRVEFDRLLSDAVSMSQGVVNPDVISSGEVVTPYTLNAEMASAYYTGVHIATCITQSEAGLIGGPSVLITPVLEQNVFMLNNVAINLINSLARFKETILSNVLGCKMFTVNYPLLIDHVLREARLYLSTINILQGRNQPNAGNIAYEQELFWNRIMAEHSKFIRGLLDPTENELFKAANDFGNEFDQLTSDAKAAMDKSLPLDKVTVESLKATQRIRDFNAQGTKGLIDCKIKSIIIPLLGDHVLRESNHYFRLLNMFKKLG